MTLSLMIKKKYLREKVEEQEKTGSFHERREYKRFWRTRIGSTTAWKDGGDAVFICGRHAFKAAVSWITIDYTPEAYTAVAGKVCYVIQCKIMREELTKLKEFVDEAAEEIRAQIKDDFRTCLMEAK